MEQSQPQLIKKQHILWFLLLVVSIVAGLSTIYINPLFTIIAIIGIINVLFTIKYPYWGLLTYLIIFMMRPAELLPALAPIRIELIFGVLVVIIIVIKQKLEDGHINFPLDKIWLSFFAILIAIFLSVFTSYEKTETINTGIAFVKIIIFVYMIISLISSKEKFAIFITCYLILITYIAVDALVAYMSGDFIHTMNVDRIKGSTSAGGDPNELGATIITAIPMAIATVFYYKNRFVKFLFAAINGLFLWIVVLTASRSGLISLFSVLFISIMFTRRKIILLLAIFALILGGWHILPEQYKDRYAKFSNIKDSESINEVSSGRVEIWKSGINMIVDRPILGVGAGAFPWAYFTGEFGPPQLMYSHNLYIQVTATMGLIGLVAWLIFQFILMSRLKLLKNLEYCKSNIWIINYAKSFIIIIISLLFSGLFGHNLYRVTWFILAGLTICLTDLNRKLEISNMT